MKTLVLGVAAAKLLGLGAFGTPAIAAPAASHSAAIAAAAMTDVSAQRYVVRKRVVRRGPHCTVRKVVTRGHHGRRVVRTTRVCR
ncbi:hypothetical protein DNX69_05610 [Rhodopseudomonas palustris]|uniref:Uncharacterized protein n=1 Tax=Rhodopseudomonas palustris TaxID=1076 RepID=A0A323UKJ8_RHOPL|nr:hypothetical protein [Rhodopseudomonas palustris]PZA12949.1 hypothetical protein DNX69_05610 [Rhodopseudomonas palustris]